MYICARCEADFSYVVLLVNLNAYILFTESFLFLTFTSKLLYEFMISPDFGQFDVKNEPAGFRTDPTGPDGKNPSDSNFVVDSYKIAVKKVLDTVDNTASVS